jgi:hypothetical protein
VTEYRTVLERAGSKAPPPQLQLEGVLHRRDSKRRNQRIRAGVLGLAIAFLVSWFSISALRSSAPVPADEGAGVFSDVGGWITYQSGWTISAVAPDGSDERAVLRTPELWALDWSPDGSRLLVKRPRSLSVIEPDGSETTLTRLERYAFGGAAFSPDGAVVVYTTWTNSGPYSSQMWAIASDGSGEGRLVLESDDELSDPTYSPDGARIAYVTGGGDHSHSLRVVDADGADVRVLFDRTTPPFDGSGHVNGIEWSPDGSLIAIATDFTDIYTVRPDGTDLRPLIPEGRSFAWSPDGSLIAYSLAIPDPLNSSEGSGIWVANADGSNQQRIAVGGEVSLWNPGAS